MTEHSDDTADLPRPKGKQLLAMVGPGKPWAELTDDEMDQMAKRIHAQMLQRLPSRAVGEEPSSKSPRLGREAPTPTDESSSN